jgi:hypothetical protein
MRCHERVSDRGDIVIVVVVLDKDGLPEKIPECDAKCTCEIGEDIEPPDLPLPTFDLAQPVFGPTDEAGEHHLGQTPAPPVERDAFPDAQVITSSSHNLYDTAPTVADPDSLSG